MLSITENAHPSNKNVVIFVITVDGEEVYSGITNKREWFRIKNDWKNAYK